MMKKKGEGRTVRRILSYVMTAVLTVPLLSGVPAKDISQVQAATTIANPRTASDGVVTWDLVYFGRYPQSDATGATTDPIKWRVLSVDGDDAFLVADSNLDAQQYNNKQAYVTWENCTMRSWLNGYTYASNTSEMDYVNNNFIDRAFTVSEQEAILTTTVKSSTNPKYNTSGGNDTQDKVFLLSYEEATNPAYGFSSSGDAEDPARVRINTAYVGAGGVNLSQSTNPEGQSGWWWMRSPGRKTNNALYVGAKGVAYGDSGEDVSVGKFAVCPAIHLNLSSTNLWSFAGTVSSNGNRTPGDEPPIVEDSQVEVEDPDTGDIYEVNDETENGKKTLEYQQPSNSKEENVEIPDTVTISGTTYKVTSIADDAFKNNKYIKTVVIGDNIKSIGKNAFRGCTKLQTVKLGKNLTFIGDSAFRGCTKLKKITIGNKVTSIEANTFRGCTNLQTVTIGKNVTSIGDYAFYNCKKLKSITIPAKVNKIGKQAFYKCKKLQTIKIKTKKLTKGKVGSKAFKGIYSKAKITVPKAKLKAYKKILKAKGVGSKAKIKK